METTALITLSHEAQELIAFAKTFLTTATAITITTPDQAQAAVEQTRKVKECAASLDETRKGYTKPLDEQKSAYMEMFRPAADTLARAEQLLKGAIGAWNTEQARLAAAEQRRLEQSERERQQAEQASAAELLRQAEQASAAGDFAAAEALEERAAAVQEVADPVVLPVTYAAPAKVRGASGRTIWKCLVVDPSKLDRAYLMPNQVVLDALAASAKGAGPAPAGCEWTSSGSVSIR